MSSDGKVITKDCNACHTLVAQETGSPTAAQAEQEEPPGLIGVLRIFKSKDLRRGLAVVNGLLKAWGNNFSARK